MDTRFEQARACFVQGLADLQQGRWAEAEAQLRQSLQLLPGRPSTLINLAAVLLQQDQPAEALALLDQALAAEPDDTQALGHRGLALHRLGQPQAALASFQRLVQRAPQQPEAWFHLAQTLQLLDEPADAVAAYDRCLALAPGHGPAWRQRGGALQDLGRRADAQASFEQALAAGDQPELDRWHLALLRGEAPPQPPRAYVERLFDDYAAGFDRHLVDTLGYRAPEHLLQLLVAHGRRDLAAVLDLGCGTGLCGPLLKPLLRSPDGRLTGLDLSANMLQQAARRGVYDELLQADLVQHLQTTAQRHDLVVAADVFIYLGDLSAVLAGVRRVLQPGGLLAFSVEPADAPGQAWQLRDTQRYAHGTQALQAQAAAHGLHTRVLEHGVLRQDQGGDLHGVFVLMAADGPDAAHHG